MPGQLSEVHRRNLQARRTEQTELRRSRKQIAAEQQLTFGERRRPPSGINKMLVG